MPGSHPKGAKVYAAWCPPVLASKIEWLHEFHQKKVPMKITVAATVRMLLEETIDQHIPENIRVKLEKGD